jgi:catechol 2,3-dioxygenase-like lactoylglutathione lyase family enzyme
MEDRMPLHLDHMILPVNDRDRSVDFYARILGLTHEGERPPFSVMRAAPDFVLQLAPFGTTGGEHLAFRLTRAEFDETFRRIRESGVDYGDSFDSVGNMRGPGDAEGAEGETKSLYLFDPSRHLIEILYYEPA